MKMWPQKWKASESPGSIRVPTVRAAVTAISAPPTRARKPRRELSRASESVRRSRCSGTRGTRSGPRESPIGIRLGALRPPPLGGRDHALQLGEVVEGPLGEHGSLGDRGRSRTGSPGSRARATAPPRRPRRRRRPRPRVASDALDRGSEAAAHVTALRAEDGERRPGPLERDPSPAAPAPRLPARGPRRRSRGRRGAEAEAEHADLSRQRQHRDTEARAATSARPRPIASHPSVLSSSGREAGQRGEGGGQSQVASDPSRLTRERAPKQAQGAPAWPRSSAPAITAATAAHQGGGAVGRRLGAESDARGEAELERRSAGPRQGRGAALGEAEARQCRPARRGRRELGERCDREHSCQHDAENDLDHPSRPKLAAAGRYWPSAALTFLLQRLRFFLLLQLAALGEGILRLRRGRPAARRRRRLAGGGGYSNPLGCTAADDHSSTPCAIPIGRLQTVHLRRRPRRAGRHRQSAYRPGRIRLGAADPPTRDPDQPIAATLERRSRGPPLSPWQVSTPPCS